MNLRSASFAIAVSTVVLAAMAVSATACPLGVELTVEHPVLPWWSRSLDPFPLWRDSKPAPVPEPKLALINGTDGGDAIVRAIGREGSALGACGKGRGELVVRRARGISTVQVSGLPEAIATCVTAAVEHAPMYRIADGTIAQISIELR